MNHRNNNRGFTLVELIIVVAIIAVLGAVIAPMYLRYVHSSKASVCLSDRQVLKREYEVAAMLVSKEADYSATLKQTLEAHGFTAERKADTADGDVVFFCSDACRHGGDYTAILAKSGYIVSLYCSKHGSKDLDKTTVSAASGYHHILDAITGKWPELTGIAAGSIINSRGGNAPGEAGRTLHINQWLSDNGYALDANTFWKVYVGQDGAYSFFIVDLTDEQLAAANSGSKVNGLSGTMVSVAADGTRTEQTDGYISISSDNGLYPAIRNTNRLWSS